MSESTQNLLLEGTPEKFADRLESGNPITYSTNLIKKGLLELLKGLPESDDYSISIKRHNGDLLDMPEVSLGEFLDNPEKHMDISFISGICVQKVSEQVGEIAA